MKTALLSVSDKTGIVEFAQELSGLGYRLLSTGGTYRALHEAGVENLMEVADFTGFPEGLEGRIKTLTPEIFGGILNLRENAEHQKFCQENKIENIDIVCVNLYPFKATYEDVAKSFEDKVENIDIGGPSMIRAAAKNYEYCASVVDPSDYSVIVNHLKAGELPLSFRKELATKVFEMTAHYDLLIAKFWAEQTKDSEEKGQLRYGENPHQKAVQLVDPFANGPLLIGAKQIQGKPLSYNNFGDSQGALELALSFGKSTDPAFAAIIKHATPCGAAIGTTISEAFDKAYDADPLSAFGGIIALNRECDKSTAEKIVTFFNEVVMAPSFSDEALEVLSAKKNVRVLEIPGFDQGPVSDIAIKRVRGGTLVQEADIELPDFANLPLGGTVQVTDTQMEDMITAWKIVKVVKSNAIVVVKDGVMIGKGGGQTSRVEAMDIAIGHAGEHSKGAVIASDAFFPFPDSVESAGAAGIAAIIQPGGSRGDAEVFAKADELGIGMVLTALRGFLH